MRKKTPLPRISASDGPVMITAVCLVRDQKTMQRVAVPVEVVVKPQELADYLVAKASSRGGSKASALFGAVRMWMLGKV